MVREKGEGDCAGGEGEGKMSLEKRKAIIEDIKEMVEVNGFDWCSEWIIKRIGIYMESLSDDKLLREQKELEVLLDEEAPALPLLAMMGG